MAHLMINPIITMWEEKQSDNQSEVHTQQARHPRTQSWPTNTPNREDIVKPLG